MMLLCIITNINQYKPVGNKVSPKTYAEGGKKSSKRQKNNRKVLKWGVKNKDSVGGGTKTHNGCVNTRGPAVAPGITPPPADLLAATSTIAAVDKSPLGVMSNTLCLKLGRFGVEECPGAIFEANPKDAGQRGKKASEGRRREGDEGEAATTHKDGQQRRHKDAQQSGKKCTKMHREGV
jgi:hypothetical protein